MSDDDYHIESTDAGASATIPMEAGQIKKGGYVLVHCGCCCCKSEMHPSRAVVQLVVE